MRYLTKTRRQLLTAMFKLFDKYGSDNVTLKQAKQAAKKIQANLSLDQAMLYGYRGAYASRAKRKKHKRSR